MLKKHIKHYYIKTNYIILLRLLKILKLSAKTNCKLKRIRNIKTKN